MKLTRLVLIIALGLALVACGDESNGTGSSGGDTEDSTAIDTPQAAQGAGTATAGPGGEPDATVTPVVEGGGSSATVTPVVEGGGSRATVTPVTENGGLRPTPTTDDSEMPLGNN
jgi:hypothetical protein